MSDGADTIERFLSGIATMPKAELEAKALAWLKEIVLDPLDKRRHANRWHATRDHVLSGIYARSSEDRGVNHTVASALARQAADHEHGPLVKP